MHPRLFRQRLLELAAEYEGLHAAATESFAEVPAVPRESSEGEAATSQSGDGEGAPPGARSALPRNRARAQVCAAAERNRAAERWLVQVEGPPDESSEPRAASDAGVAAQRGPAGQLAAHPDDDGSAARIPRNHARLSAGSFSIGSPVPSSHMPETNDGSSVPDAVETMRSSRRESGDSFATSVSAAFASAGAVVRNCLRRDTEQMSEQRPTTPQNDRNSYWSWLSLKETMKFSNEVKRSTARKSSRRSTSVDLQKLQQKPLADFVKSRYFAMGSALVIIMSTVLIGIETQIFSSLSHQGSDSKHLAMALSAANYLLTLVFAVEVLMRIYVLGIMHPGDRVWNCFDIAILLLALAEIALELVVLAILGKDHNLFDGGGMAKMLRLFRLTRLLRIIRTFRQLKPLRVLVHSIASAGKSVFWALMLLFMIIFSFGVILTQAVSEHTEGGTRVDDDDLVSYYGDLLRSMLSLMMAVSGGISWHELTAPLQGTGNIGWMFLFLVYITFVYFFVLNVVTGVFCQNAIEGAQQDLDLTIEAQLREKQVYADRLKLLFEEMNQDCDPEEGLTAADINEQMEKPKVQSFFKALDIDAKQTWKLFKVLDSANSGAISLQDFVEGCLQMKGSATRVDVESLKWEIRAANKRAVLTADRIAELLEQISASGAAACAACGGSVTR
ncbi:unnamed protein product [Prorocentrum cordatum]|uniref:EF-hand domain-containing protein n=1 Tax=Prorocentrum cordatum TaxID=2364126 RepID=A0ABN9Y800_9DINO|nr:unnamed protein product [Polarella glacialis]